MATICTARKMWPYPNKMSYGAGLEKWKIEYETFTSPSNKKIEMSTIVCEYHLEVNPSDEDIMIVL